ncbi:MAG: homocysteine S-methyltransferase family protein [Berryella intestinalis]|uniref:homocysteine S-methyltransferase family protein n=1 Tax=Berryella intestinalis TaxID=1531429 RepID=UPI002A50C1FB|nr:homocysteine S-methyltransferase family protein [Berryella intestinalis]MDD7368533.1 homocysteine S-methyltransferase family protein [Berryella intestinalis]MDY3129948.1 homocysteine S-methyltransferase family protein [Berryella intestinalis]
MPDISLRFNRDMLVISSPVENVLARQGVDMQRDLFYLALMEPEGLVDALRLDLLAGAQCLVVPTASLTPARLAQISAADEGTRVARALFDLARELKPQHILAEIGPCGLPLDASSKASLNEHRAQYARAARDLAPLGIDGVFLNGFSRVTELKCALMGFAQVVDAPLFASVDVDGEGRLASSNEPLEDALSAMADLGAAVGGFATAAPAERASELARRARVATELPLMVQLSVGSRDDRSDAAYASPDAMVTAAAHLHAAGVQFVRASGEATPAYTGALVAAVTGLDVLDR